MKSKPGSGFSSDAGQLREFVYQNLNRGRIIHPSGLPSGEFSGTS
jgi:hypothetical protein